MKAKIILLLTILLVHSAAYSQISLVGASISQDGNIDIVTWQALDPSSVQTYETELVGYYLSSSVFDAYSGTYHLSGLTEDTQGLFSFNTRTQEQDMAPFTNFSNITEIDMSTGKIYNLTSDSLEYFSINEYDIGTGNDSLIGVIHEPGTNGIIVDAIAFNSNDGILYYLGYDSTGAVLYAVPVREEVFTYTKTALQVEYFASSIYSINYDNVNGLIFGLNTVYDSSFNVSGTNIVGIDPETGAVETRGELAEFTGFFMGSACFDQFSGSYLVIGIDTNNNAEMIVFDTYSNVYTTGWVPNGVSEIVSDNGSFAMSTYILTGLPSAGQPGDIKVFPNPAGPKVTISGLSEAQSPQGISIFSMDGRRLIHMEYEGDASADLDVSGLKPGVYLLKTDDTTLKLVIK